MNTKKTLMLMLAACAGAAMISCENWRINRHDPEETIDYSYRFDDDDAREIYRGMVNDALSRPWINNWLEDNAGERPVVVVGDVRNETSDYIDSRLVTKRFEEELINSGMVRVIAARDQESDVRDERFNKEFDDPATIKAAAMELGADFILLGAIRSVQERTRDQRKIVQFYQFELELVNVESAEKVWIQTEQIKKTASR